MKWTLLETEKLLDTPWIVVEKQRYRLPSGSEINDYYVVSRRPFVLVVAGTPESVVLVRQYRPATDDVYVSLPAGYIGDDESPETAAARELHEEAGITAVTTRVIGTLDPLPGYIRSRAFVVLAEVLPDDLVTHDSEEIGDVFWASWPEVNTMLRDGRIREMQAVSALLLAKHVTAL